MRKVLLVLLALIGMSFSEGDRQFVPTPLTKDVGEYFVSVGVMSITELREIFPRAYKLLVRHHGKPPKEATHHIAVSVWKEMNEKVRYMSDMRVELELRSPILRAVRRYLDRYPHERGDNFGGWFNMSDKGLYHIAVIIHEHGGEVKRVDFDYLIQ